MYMYVAIHRPLAHDACTPKDCQFRDCMSALSKIHQTTVGLGRLKQMSDNFVQAYCGWPI